MTRRPAARAALVTCLCFVAATSYAAPSELHHDAKVDAGAAQVADAAAAAGGGGGGDDGGDGGGGGGGGGGERVPEKGSPLDLAAAPVPNREEISATDAELAAKLHKMKELISGIHSGVDKSSRLRATSMGHKFNKLSTIIAALAKEKDGLFRENVQLRREMKATVQRLQRVETQLQAEAKRADDNDVRRWFEAKSGEITEFLHSNGLQHYEDPKFSPVMAGLVTYGLVLVPLMLASGYITRNIKFLSLLHVLTAVNIFETGYVAATILSMPLLLTLDPFHALRHISDMNFIFLQLVLAALFWAAAAILVITTLRTHTQPASRRALAAQLLLRAALACDYGLRVWAPVVDRSDAAVLVPPAAYAAYAAAVVGALLLTGRARAACGPGPREVARSAAVPVEFRGDEEAPAPGVGVAGVAEVVAQQLLPAAQHAD
jgi:hypothetical protein